MNPRPQRQRPGKSSPVGRPTLKPEPEQIKVGNHVAEPSPAHSQTPEVTDSVSAEVPKYRTLVRKEARVRADQADALAQLTRSRSRDRTEHSERITDNTLIRVAVDLLLAHADQLHGNTEDELRESVTRRLTDSDSL